jgi:hypothetical protein
MGLLGALGGLGVGLNQMGRDIQKRREDALEDARREAEYQRRLADSRETKRMDQEFDLDKAAAHEDRTDARTEYTVGARAKEKQADRDLRVGESKEKFAQQKELTRLRATLQRDNDKASEAARAALTRELDAKDVRSVEYGAPDAGGYAEVILVTRNGELRHTGKRVYKPKLDFKEADEDEDEPKY